MVEPYSFKLITYKPSAENACNFVVVENVGIDGVDSHQWTARFQHDKIT